MAFAPLPFDHLEWNGSRWDMTRRLGHGKFAIVYEVTRCEPPYDKLAAKVICTDRMSSWARTQLRSEVQIWQRLSHPHICKLYGNISFSQHEVLLLEFAEGGELFERIVERECFTEREAARLMRELLSAVAYLHDQGVMHRDLKPENLLLSSMGDGASLRIADFGACKRVSRSGLTPGMPSHATTPCGSLGYAAPEQIRQQMYERQCDVWSAGVVAYVLLSGCMPFDPTNYMGSSFELKFPGDLWENVSTAAVNFIQDMLQIDPDRRPSAHVALDHPWLTNESPLPTPLPTPCQLKSLRNSGNMEDMFCRANDVWQIACASTPLVGLAADALAKRPRLTAASTDGGDTDGSRSRRESDLDGERVLMQAPEVPVLSLPTHLHKRLKSSPPPIIEVELEVGR